MSEAPSVERIALVERDVRGKREVWTARVHGRQVIADVSMDEFARLWGRVAYRDFVVAKLLQEAGA